MAQVSRMPSIAFEAVQALTRGERQARAHNKFATRSTLTFARSQTFELKGELFGQSREIRFLFENFVNICLGLFVDCLCLVGDCFQRDECNVHDSQAERTFTLYAVICEALDTINDDTRRDALKFKLGRYPCRVATGIEGRIWEAFL